MSGTKRRSGAETRAEILRVALDLFTTQGYESTSLRQIADELGIQKASLYYHFAGKEEIVRAGFAARGSEAQDLLEWAESQPQAPDLLARCVLRWIDTYSVEKLRGIRFVNANPTVTRAIATDSSAVIRDPLEALVALVGDAARGVDRVLIRMAFLSINAAAGAAAVGTPDDEIVAAARRTSVAILAALDES